MARVCKTHGGYLLVGRFGVITDPRESGLPFGTRTAAQAYARVVGISVLPTLGELLAAAWARLRRILGR